MATRIATSMSLVVFAICLLIGGVATGNPFTTTVVRALVAMMCTFVIGTIVGAMAQKMLDENLKNEENKSKENEANNVTTDR